MHKDLLSPGWFACDCRSERGEEPQDKASTADPDLVFNSLLREARSEVSKKFGNLKYSRPTTNASQPLKPTRQLAFTVIVRGLNDTAGWPSGHFGFQRTLLDLRRPIMFT